VKILVLTQVLPYPPDSGPKVKTWNVIKHLAREHSLTIASFVRGDQRADEIHLSAHGQVRTVPMVRSALADARALLRSLRIGQPWMMVRDERAAMDTLIGSLTTEGCDAVHADQLNMAQYALQVPRVPRVLDAHNCLWLLYRRLAETMRPGPRRWLLERDWRLLRDYEGAMVRAFDQVLAVSDEDAEALCDAAGVRRDVRVVPIAVDADEVRPVERSMGADHILHVGTMYWPPNIDGLTWFLDEVLPLIRAQRQDVVVDLVGARPPKRLVQRAARDPNLRIPGYVSDLTPFVSAAGVFVVPLRAGGGMRVKILNAMAQGLPIVSTTLGAEGIAVRHGEHLLLADAPSDLAQAVLQVLANSDLQQRLGEAGRRLVEERYDYRVTCRALDAVYGVNHLAVEATG
jgi:polysaccharide biosynthesis protein PslH